MTKEFGTHALRSKRDDGSLDKAGYLDFLASQVVFYLNALEFRVLFSVFSRTALYNKLAERIPEKHFLAGVWSKNRHGRCHTVPVAGLKEGTTISRSTLFKVLNSLEEKGLIERSREFGGATTYRLLCNPQFAAEQHARLFGGGRNPELRRRLLKNRKLISSGVSEGKRQSAQEAIYSEGGVRVRQLRSYTYHSERQRSVETVEYIIGEGNGAASDETFTRERLLSHSKAVEHCEKGRWVPSATPNALGGGKAPPPRGIRILPKPVRRNTDGGRPAKSPDVRHIEVAVRRLADRKYKEIQNP